MIITNDLKKEAYVWANQVLDDSDNPEDRNDIQIVLANIVLEKVGLVESEETLLRDIPCNKWNELAGVRVIPVIEGKIGGDVYMTGKYNGSHSGDLYFEAIIQTPHALKVDSFDARDFYVDLDADRFDLAKTV